MVNQESIKIESLEDPTREWTKLFGGTVNDVWRSGDIVKRRRGHHEDAIVQLLTWLRNRGVPAIPEVIGISDQSVYLRFTEGEAVLRPWVDAVKTDAWLFQLGDWLSRSHAAMPGFQLQSGASFVSGPVRPEPGMVVCHGDLGPWNFLQKAGSLTGVIDWDLAHFGLPLDDMAFMAIEASPLRRSTEATMGEDVPRSVLMNRLEVLLHAYGKVTVAEILAQAVDALDQLIEQTQANASRYISPFDEFIRRDFLEDYAEDREYIKEFWIRSTRL
jgi:hypothetical protein